MSGKYLEPLFYAGILGVILFAVIFYLSQDARVAVILGGGLFLWQFEKRHFDSIPDDAESGE